MIDTVNCDKTVSISVPPSVTNASKCWLDNLPILKNNLLTNIACGTSAGAAQEVQSSHLLAGLPVV